MRGTRRQVFMVASLRPGDVPGDHATSLARSPDSLGRQAGCDTAADTGGSGSALCATPARGA
jgi:hypothetical protein